MNIKVTAFTVSEKSSNIDVNLFFTFNDNNTRGHILRITAKPSVNKSLRLNSFPVPLRAINSWNSLPEPVVTCTSDTLVTGSLTSMSCINTVIISKFLRSQKLS